ncbi:hypothetical protein DXG01_014643, partial [Tephrocybe rancida]
MTPTATTPNVHTQLANMSVVDINCDFHAFARSSVWVPKHPTPARSPMSGVSSIATIFETPGNRPFGPFSYSLSGPTGPSVSVDIPTYRARYHGSGSSSDRLYNNQVAKYRHAMENFDETSILWLSAKRKLSLLEAFIP